MLYALPVRFVVEAPNPNEAMRLLALGLAKVPAVRSWEALEGYALPTGEPSDDQAGPETSEEAEEEPP